MQGILTGSGVTRTSSVTDAATGELYPCTTMLRQDGENFIFGILKAQTTAPDGKEPMLFNSKFLRKVKIELPFKGHVYDLRKGKYIGFTNTIVTDLMPGDGQVFAIQKEKTARVEIQTPGTAVRGKALEVNCAAVGASGNQVFRMELYAPCGKLAGEYTMTGHFKADKGIFRFQFAHNDKAGIWKCRVVHVNSGLSAERKFVLK